VIRRLLPPEGASVLELYLLQYYYYYYPPPHHYYYYDDDVFNSVRVWGSGVAQRYISLALIGSSPLYIL
jgi:hypothetical protein